MPSFYWSKSILRVQNILDVFKKNLVMKNHFDSCPKLLGPKYFCPGLNLFWTCIKMKLQIYRKVSIPLHIVALFMRKTANNAYCIYVTELSGM